MTDVGCPYCNACSGGAFCELSDGVRLPRFSLSKTKGLISGEVRELPGKSGKLAGNLWIAHNIHSERSSAEAARELPGKFGEILSGLQKGPAERGHVKKTSKVVRKCQKVSRHFSTIFAQGKERQKSSKSVKKFFDTFRQFSRGTIIPAPFGGL